MTGLPPPAGPEISVVIPTWGRPEMVVEAVRSALAQEGPALEVVVVPDGDDPAAVAALAQVADPRLRLALPGDRVGNAEARNVGIRAARGPWIALLDDDDLWLPGKLLAQIAAAEASALPSPIVTCRFLARSETAEFLWPRRLPAPGRAGGRLPLPPAAAAHRRRRGADLDHPGTDGAVRRRYPSTTTAAASSTSTGSCAPRASPALASSSPIPRGRSRSGGWRSARRISTRGDWREDVDWIAARRHLVSDRAAAAFLLTLPSIRAARQGDLGAFATLFRAALASGRPSWAEFVFHAGNFALPSQLRAQIARFFN